jgi:hypothetical protein
MSKRVIVAIIVFVVLVGLAIVATQIKSAPTKYENDLIVSEKQTEKLYKDTDNDGLKDWEEDLWKTDPNKPDTDGDGTNDFEEIRLGRNPLIKGPDDKLDKETIDKKINSSLESDLTETDKFSRELFAKYIAAQKSGNYKSVDYPGFLIETVANAEKGTITILKETDFKKITETSEAIRNYGNAFGKIIKEKEKEFPGNELQILDDASTKGEKKEITALDKPIARYRAIREGLLTIDVPESLLKIHTKIVNLLEVMAVGIESMKFTLSDPVRAMSGMSMYPDATNLFIESIQDLRLYFINHKIIFEKNESGYDFTRGV